MLIFRVLLLPYSYTDCYSEDLNMLRWPREGHKIAKLQDQNKHYSKKTKKKIWLFPSLIGRGLNKKMVLHTVSQVLKTETLGCHWRERAFRK